MRQPIRRPARTFMDPEPSCLCLRLGELLRKEYLLITTRDDSFGSGSAFNNRLTRTRAQRLFQSTRNRPEASASEEPPCGTTERTSDSPPLAGPAAGCGSRGALIRVACRGWRMAKQAPIRLLAEKLARATWGSFAESNLPQLKC
jgi:hypothetical protein